MIVTDFIPDFVDHLNAADISVSMAGYNTTMNLLAVGTHGLVYPFEQNREQALRSSRLEKLGALQILKLRTLNPETLCEELRKKLTYTAPPLTISIDLDGAEKTVSLLENMMMHQE